MKIVFYCYHFLRAQYYGAALSHLSTFDPTHSDLLHVILEHSRSQAVLRGWN